MPATQPERSCRLDDLDGVPVLVIACTNRGVTYRDFYRIENNPAPGCVAYRLHKLTHSDEEPTCYDVLLRGEGAPSCDCRGHLAHSHCKHMEALEALLAAGKLPK